MMAPDCRVLLVEDEADLLATYQRLLRRQGCQVTAAGTRREALHAIEDDHFALVVADLRLPDGDGLDVVRAARAIARPPAVIVVTGFASEGSRRQAFEAGAAAYLRKPFAIAEFTTLVERTLAGAGPDSGPGNA